VSDGGLGGLTIPVFTIDPSEKNVKNV